MKVLCIVVLLACAASVRADQKAATEPADEDRVGAIENIELRIRELAAISDPAGPRLAASMRDVLLKHHIAIPKDLADLKAAEPAGKPTDEVTDAIGRIIANVATVDSEVLLSRTAGEADQLPLGVDLLLKVMRDSDVRPAKLTAAVYLADGLFAHDGSPRYSIDIADGAAERGMEMSFEDVRSEIANHRLSFAARANALSAVAALAETWAIRLPGLQSAATESDEVRAAMEERIVKLEGLATDVEKAADGQDDMAKFAAALRDVVTALRKAAVETSPKVAVANQVSPVLRGFLAAISGEDREAIRKFVTPRSAEQMLAIKSIRDELGRRRGVKEIRLATFPRVSVSGGDKGVQKLSFVLEVTDSGGEIRRVQSTGVAVREAGAWLLGGGE